MKKLNLSEREKYEIAKQLKDAIYDMDSLNSLNREMAHKEFKRISNLLGKDNMNKLLDEFKKDKDYVSAIMFTTLADRLNYFLQKE